MFKKPEQGFLIHAMTLGFVIYAGESKGFVCEIDLYILDKALERDIKKYKSL
jgi:hypothetical protein